MSARLIDDTGAKGLNEVKLCGLPTFLLGFEQPGIVFCLEVDFLLFVSQFLLLVSPRVLYFALFGLDVLLVLLALLLYFELFLTDL